RTTMLLRIVLRSSLCPMVPSPVGASRAALCQMARRCTVDSDEQRERAASVPVGPTHRCHLRHHRGAKAWLRSRKSGAVQPRSGPAGDRRAPRGATPDPHTPSGPGGRTGMHAGEGDAGDEEYAPVAGIWELREAIASHYNRTYRRGMPSQYSAENVAISGGGRASLTRAAASLGLINLGHFLPDYT